MPPREAYKFTSEDAENYDQYLGPILFEPYGKYLASHIDPADLSNVLELASGTGRVTQFIRNALPPHTQLLATDISSDMLNIAKRRLATSNITYQTEDIQNLSFADSQFDLAICQFGMMFLNDKQKGFSEIFRVLKPGAKFLCFTWSNTPNNPLFHLIIDELLLPFFADEDPALFYIPFSLHEPQQLKAWMQHAGFSNIQTEIVNLQSGASSPEHVLNAAYLKHPLGKALHEKQPTAYHPVAEKFRSEIEKRYGASASFPMSAILTTGTK